MQESKKHEIPHPIRQQEQRPKSQDIIKETVVLKNENNLVLQKEIKLCSLTRPITGEIEVMAKKFNLVYENLDENILIAGPQYNILEFMSWIYELTVKTIEDELWRQRDAREAEIHSGDYHLEKIFTSTFHRTHKDKILKKARELHVVCNFGYDFIVASATKRNFDEFKSYLYEVEVAAKKLLYPKYWDFDDNNSFSEIGIPQTTPEYKLVASLLYKSLKTATITKLTRIQNKF